MRYSCIVDAHAWIAYFRGEKAAEVTRRYIEGGEGATPTIVIAELSSKFAGLGEKDWERALTFVKLKTAVIDLTLDVAAKAGALRNEIGKKAKGFGLADAIIYETARQNGAKVLTGDTHFKDLENVNYIG